VVRRAMTKRPAILQNVAEGYRRSKRRLRDSRVLPPAVVVVFMDYSDDSCMDNFTPTQATSADSLSLQYRGL
jgi:hypothetical protein